MTALVRPLQNLFANAHFAMNLQLEGLDDETARRRARGDEGASITWIVGHVLGYRIGALQTLGVDHPDRYGDLFSLQGSADGEPELPPIAELSAEWNTVHEKLVAALGAATEEQLLADAPFPLPQEDRSVLGMLSFLAYHEACHMGSMGTLRVQLGLEHTHVLAMRALGMRPAAEAAESEA